MKTSRARVLQLRCGPGVVSGHRLPQIDELKGLAIFLVIFYHGGGAMGAPNLVHGEIGVDIFLLLSGLTLALSSTELTLREFFYRRFFRIFPSYWLALGLFLWMGIKFYGAHKSWPNIVTHVLGVHGYGALVFFTDINASFWFISMIVAAYAVFFLLRRRLGDLSLLVAVCGVLSVIAGIAYQVNGHVGGLIHLAVRIPSFFLGLVAGQLLRVGEMRVTLNFKLGLGLGCFYYLIFFRNLTFAYSLAAVAFVLTWVALHRALRGYYVGRGFLALFGFLGVISYELYLFHQPFLRDYSLNLLQRMIALLSPTKPQMYGVMFVMLGVTTLFGFGLNRLSRWAFSRFREKQREPHPVDALLAGPAQPVAVKNL